MFYTALVHREGDQWLAEFPDAPGCQTFADSVEQLRVDAEEAITGWLEAHLVGGEAPPIPLRERAPMRGSELWQVHIPAVLASALAIRWARQRLNWTQNELAQRLGVSQQQVAKLENPDANPTLATIERAAQALGLQFDVSFGK